MGRRLVISLIIMSFIVAVSGCGEKERQIKNKETAEIVNEDNNLTNKPENNPSKSEGKSKSDDYYDSSEMQHLKITIL